ILELFPVLGERRNQFAGTLSGGEQQMLAIGRGLASAPELLMLDEPSMGLAPALADAIFERIREIHRVRGLTVLLVEQRVVEALEACDHGYVLETGRGALHGPYDTPLSGRAREAGLSRDLAGPAPPRTGTHCGLLDDACPFLDLGLEERFQRRGVARPSSTGSVARTLVTKLRIPNTAAHTRIVSGGAFWPRSQDVNRGMLQLCIENGSLEPYFLSLTTKH